MGDKVPVKNVLLIALGGSGRKIAVALNEKINLPKMRPTISSEINCQIFAIDSPFLQDGGYFVNPDDYFSFFYIGLDLNSCWKRMESEIKQGEIEVEPWMKIGTITEGELWLARDAQQSGIRRVDYKLLIHQSRNRLLSELKKKFLRSFPKVYNQDPEVHVIITGSLSGRTGSMSFRTLLESLDFLANEFKIVKITSLLHSPRIFEELYWRNDERFVNFMTSTNEVKDYLHQTNYEKAKPQLFLIDQVSPLFVVDREDDKPLPECEIVEKLVNLVSLESNVDNYKVNFDNWSRDFGLADLSKLESSLDDYLAKANHLKTIGSDHDEVFFPCNRRKMNYRDIFKNL